MTEEKKWEKMSSDVVRLDKKDDHIEGVLISVDDGDYNNKKYTIKVKEGKNCIVFGTTVLDDLMKNIAVGKEVKIVNIGEKDTGKKGQNPLRLFDVFVR